MNSSTDTYFSPTKYLVFGVLFAYFGAYFMTMFLSVGTAWLLGYDLMSESTVYEVATDELILFVDIMGSFLMFYLAGRLFAKYVSGDEKKYAVTLGIVLVVIYSILFYLSSYSWLTPFWYFIVFLGGIIPTIYYGTQSKINA